MSWLWNRNAGLSLVELMVAVCILAVGIVGVLRSFLSASVVLDDLNRRAEAMVLLDRGIADWDENGAFGSEPDLEKDELLGARKAVFRRRVVVREADKDAGFGLVTLSASWKEGAVVREESVAFLSARQI